MKRDVALALLGLSVKGLDEARINAAYKSAMRISHPDRYANNEQLRAHAEEQCKLINEARDTLLRQLPKDKSRTAQTGKAQNGGNGQDGYRQQKNQPRANKQAKEQTRQAERNERAEQTEHSKESKRNEEARHSGESEQTEQEKKSATPVLDSWKTSKSFSVLGLVTAMTVITLEKSLTFGAYMLLGISFMALGVVYAAKIFPSLFGNKPGLKSNKGISFLNFFVPSVPMGVLGGIIFGCIWNYSLTNKELGVSRWVFIALLIALFLWFIWMWFG